MFFGYNTNGFAHHRLEDILAILSELGYQGVAITLDYHVLNPFSANLFQEIKKTQTLLDRYQLVSVIETGSRFLLDPRRKHQPTLLSSDQTERERRLDFLRRATDIAADLGSTAVSFWSGKPDDEADYDTHLERLTNGVIEICGHAILKRVSLAVEPEPGMFIDTMSRFENLKQAVDARAAGNQAFGLTIDVGHLHCQGETPIAQYLKDWKPLVRNIHIEDMRRGVHDHLMFGEGEMDFPPILHALKEIGYAGGVYVELSRHSHDAVETARRSLEFLRKAAT